MDDKLLSLFRTKEGKIVVGQKPNLPIILAGMFYLLRLIKPLYIFSEIGFVLFLSIWALWEITEGVNLWRRYLGLFVLLMLLSRLLN